jgi:hypothetical protein
MQNSLAGRDCSHGQDLVAAEHSALPDQCEMHVVGLKRSLYLLPARSEEVKHANSPVCLVSHDVK